MKHTSFAPPARLNGFIPRADVRSFTLRPSTGQATGHSLSRFTGSRVSGRVQVFDPAWNCWSAGPAMLQKRGRAVRYGTEDPMAIDRPLPRGHCSLKSLPGLIGHSCFFVFFSDFKFLAQLVQGKALFNNGHWVFGSVLDKHHQNPGLGHIPWMTSSSKLWHFEDEHFGQLRGPRAGGVAPGTPVPGFPGFRKLGTFPKRKFEVSLPFARLQFVQGRNQFQPVRFQVRGERLPLRAGRATGCLEGPFSLGGTPFSDNVSELSSEGGYRF